MKKMLLVTIVGCIFGNGVIAGRIHEAATEGDIVAVELELARGVSVNELDESLDRPLHSAVRGRNIGVINALLKAGANPRHFNADGHSPLNLALRQGDIEMIDVLLRAGAFPTLRSASGYSPLHVAIVIGDAEAIWFLLDRDADVTAVTDGGISPIELALSQPKISIFILAQLLGINGNKYHAIQLGFYLEQPKLGITRDRTEWTQILAQFKLARKRNRREIHSRRLIMNRRLLERHSSDVLERILKKFEDEFIMMYPTQKLGSRFVTLGWSLELLRVATLHMDDERDHSASAAAVG